MLVLERCYNGVWSNKHYEQLRNKFTLHRVYDQLNLRKRKIGKSVLFYQALGKRINFGLLAGKRSFLANSTLPYTLF